MATKPEDLSKWLGKEADAGALVHIAQANDEDILADLKRGLKEARGAKKINHGSAPERFRLAASSIPVLRIKNA